MRGIRQTVSASPPAHRVPRRAADGFLRDSGSEEKGLFVVDLGTSTRSFTDYSARSGRKAGFAALVDVRPMVSMNNRPHRRGMNPEVTRNRGMPLARRRSTPDLAHLLRRELCLSRGLPARLAGPASLDHFGQVVGLSSRLQVARVDAAPIVAGVLHHKPIGHGAMGQFVSKTVSLRGGCPPAQSKPAVAGWRRARVPVPALVWPSNRNVSEESHSGVFGFSSSHANDYIRSTPETEVKAQ